MDDIKILNKKIVHDDWLQVEIHRLQYPNGQEQNYHTIKFKDAENGVAIIGITEKNKIILITQYRYAVGKEMLELPMGGVMKGEKAEHAAKRELEEETGYKAKEIKKISIKYPLQNLTNHHITYFIATGLTKGKSKPEPTEKISSIKQFTIEEALQKVINGEISDTVSSTGILLYDKIRLK